MSMFTVEVAVVGVTRVRVEAEDAEHAKFVAAEGVTPFSIEEWRYVPDWAVEVDDEHLVMHA